MATLKQYATRMWQTHRAVSQKLGMDPAVGGADERVRALTTDVLLSGILKILVDKGVTTDAELTALYTTLANANYPQQSIVPQPEEGPAPDPDLGS